MTLWVWGVALLYSSCYCDGERLQCWRERSKVTATSSVYSMHLVCQEWSHVRQLAGKEQLLENS